MRDLEYYLRLPYTKVLIRDSEGDIVARVNELPGCVAHGSTEAEALDSLAEVQKAWLEEAIEVGRTIPEPAPEELLASGKWLQRVPRTLHTKLARLARSEQVSLNQLVTSILAEAVGVRQLRKQVFSHMAVYYTTHAWSDPTWRESDWRLIYHHGQSHRIGAGFLGNVRGWLPTAAEEKKHVR